jgi:hypothetical protein
MPHDLPITLTLPARAELRAGFASSLPVVPRARYRVDAEIARGGMGRGAARACAELADLEAKLAGK